MKRTNAERAAITALILTDNVKIKDVASIIGVHPVRARDIALNTIGSAYQLRHGRFRRFRNIYGTESIAELKKQKRKILPLLWEYARK